jgi:hypothetical protein
MSVRADIIDKLKEICELAVTTATLGQWDLEPKVVVKPSGAAIDIPREGLVVLRVVNFRSERSEIGGGPGNNPMACTLNAAVEFYVADQAQAGKDEAADALMTAIGEPIESDPNLGFTGDSDAEDVDAQITEGDEETFGDLGTDEFGGALVFLTVNWTNRRSLG